MSSPVGVGRGLGRERNRGEDMTIGDGERDTEFGSQGWRGLAFLGNVIWIGIWIWIFFAIKWGSCVLHWLGYLGTTTTDNAASIWEAIGLLLYTILYVLGTSNI